MAQKAHTVRLVALLLLPFVLAAGGFFVFKYATPSRVAVLHTEKDGDPEQGERELTAAEEEADRTDPHWRFAELDAQREQVPDAENAAGDVRSAEDKLPRDWPRQSVLDELNRLPARAPLSDSLNSAVGEELHKATFALALARRLAEHSRGRWEVAWTPDYLSTDLTHLAQIQRAQELLRLDAVHAAQANEPGRALAAARGILNAGRSVGDEPTLKSILARIRSHFDASMLLERILGRTQPDEADLATVQSLLEDEAAQPLICIAARGERATLHGLMLAVEGGTLKRSDLEPPGPGDRKPTLKNQLLSVLNDTRMSNHGALLEAHAWLLRYLTQFVEIAKLPIEDQAVPMAKLESGREGAPRGGQKLAPDVRSIIQTAQISQAMLRTAAVALALERYRSANGRWPKSLEELVPTYLKAVPLDPYDGKPLRFKRQVEGVVVYALGPDGEDNGGAFGTLNSFQKGTDVGFRLWDVEKRRPEARP
jgi:hypothetical protein